MKFLAALIIISLLVGVAADKLGITDAIRRAGRKTGAGLFNAFGSAGVIVFFLVVGLLLLLAHFA